MQATLEATLEATDRVPAALGPLGMGVVIPDPGLFFVLEVEDEQALVRIDDGLDEVLALRCASL